MKAPFLLLAVMMTAFPAGAAVVFSGNIPDPASFDPFEAVTPNVNQVFSDFPTFSSMVIDDLTVASTQRRIINITTLIRAQAGMGAFQDVTGYQVSVFSDPAAAASSLTGDVASVLVAPGSGVSVTPFAPAVLDEYGLVSLDIEILLPTAGTYWVGVAPVAANTIAGQFFAHNSPAPIPGSPGTAHFANPGGGFNIGPLTTIDAVLAQDFILIPEPSAYLLLSMASLASLRRRRRFLPL